MLGCFQLSKSLALLIFNFIALFLKPVYREFSNYYLITCITNPARLLRWTFFAKTGNELEAVAIFSESPS